MGAVSQVQLGKNGLTEGFIESLKNHFKKHKNVKVSVLSSCCRDKSELTEITKKILDELGDKYSARTIGYTIAIKKLRKTQ